MEPSTLSFWRVKWYKLNKLSHWSDAPPDSADVAGIERSLSKKSVFCGKKGRLTYIHHGFDFK